MEKLEVNWLRSGPKVAKFTNDIYRKNFADQIPEFRGITLTGLLLPDEPDSIFGMFLGAHERAFQKVAAFLQDEGYEITRVIIRQMVQEYRDATSVNGNFRTTELSLDTKSD